MDAKVNASIPEIDTRSHKPIEGISECMIMQDTVHRAAMAILANVSLCLNEKIEEGENYVTDIIGRSKLALEQITEIKNESAECMKNLSGIAEITTAIGCVAEASTKGTLAVGRTVPAVSVDFAKLLWEISTLQATLPVCMQTNAILTLAQEAEAVVWSIKDCIKEKLEGGGSTGESSEEEWNNEVVDKHPQVPHQPNFDDETGKEHHGLIEVRD